MNKHIRSIDKDNLIKYFKDKNIEKFHALQVFEWIHKKHILDVNCMTNIKKDLRDMLAIEFSFYKNNIIKMYDSKIDDTKKFLFKLQDDNIIECVLMKYDFGNSLCISTQVGCKMGCKFCASTINGFIRDLSVDELISQVYDIEDYTGKNINNIVLMGIGEPLNNINNVLDFIKIISDVDGKNISNRNITISTCGIVPKIMDLSNENNKFTLALSLHAPNDEIRKKIMPIANIYNIEETLNAISMYYITTKRRITIEYSLMDNINCDIEDAKELSKLFYKYFISKGVDFNVNLIPVNEVEECNIYRPDRKKVIDFREELLNNNINVTIRRELGKDISGSCGQLRRSNI